MGNKVNPYEWLEPYIPIRGKKGDKRTNISLRQTDYNQLSEISAQLRLSLPDTVATMLNYANDNTGV